MQIPAFPPTSLIHLENGFKAILRQDHTHPIVCLQLYVRAGSIFEAPRQAGFSHLVEHLVFKRTRDFAFNEITLKVNDLGGNINAYTDTDSTCYYIMLPSEHAREGFNILSQIARHAQPVPKDLRAEQDIIVEEINQYANDPEVSFLENTLQKYLSTNPMRLPVMGSAKSVRDATLVALKRYYQRHYTASNSFMAVAGDIGADQVRCTLIEFFGDWAQLKRPHFPKSISRFKQPEKMVFRTEGIPGTGNLVALVLPELPETHKDSLALSIVIRHLAYGRASILHKALVDNTRLCSSVKVIPHSGILSGATTILLSPTSLKANRAIGDILACELHSLQTNGIGADELEMIRKDLIHTWAYDMDGNENIASMIGSEELLGDYNRLYEFPSKIEGVTVEAVNAAIRLYLRKDRLAVYYTTNGKTSGTQDDFFDLRCSSSPKARKNSYPSCGIDTRTLYHDTRELIPPINDIQIDASHRLYTYPDGLRFFHGWRPGRDITGFALAFPVSQLCEGPSERGLNYFTTSAMLYATRKLATEQLLCLCRGLGLDISVSHQTDCTIFHGKCQSRYLAQALHVLREIVFEPLLAAKHINTIKATARDDIHRENDYPETRAYLEWLGILLGRSNQFGRATGNLGDVRSVTSDKVKNWHNRYYHQNHSVLSICGPMPAEEANTIVAGVFGGDPVTADTPQGYLPALQAAPHARIDKRGSQQAIIHVGGFMAPGMDQEATTAMHVLAQVIGGESSSRLFDLLREKHAFAYQCGMDMVITRDLSFWYIYAMCDLNDHQQCLDHIKDVLSDVARNGVTAQEIELAVNYLVGMHRYDSESATYQAMELASLLALGYPPDHVMHREKRLRGVDREAIHAAASRWLQPNALFTYVLL